VTDRGESPPLLHFGTFELDLSSHELRKAGALIKLQSQHFQLLVLLAERAGQLVTREEIRRTLWTNGTFVDFDRSINFGVNQIRGALGDDPQSPRYIETLPRKGYRFVAPVTEAGGEPAKAQLAPESLAVPQPVASRRWWLLSAGAAVFLVAIALAAKMGVSPHLGTKPIRSLAVLPLENLSHDPEQQYFADGMTDELITALAKISALRVVSRTSVMQYKGLKKSISQIARELNVEAVLEGTVTRDRNRMRITAQLIGAAPEKHLWAEKYEGSLEQVLTLQDLVASAVAREIQIQLTPRERTLLASRRAVDPEAYEAYMKGRYLWEGASEENLRKSQDYFEQAIKKDPGYALAWAGLADTYDYLASWGVVPRKDSAPRARAAAQKALDLDSGLAGPLITLASAKTNLEWDWAGAERLCKRAIELNPNYGHAHHWYATFLAAVGRVREAVVEARRAHDVEPLSGVFHANVIWKLYLAHQYEEAELEFRKMREWHPSFTGGYIMASVYLQTRRQQEAIAELQQSAAKSHRSILQLMYLGHALGVSGARAEGNKVLEEMQSLSKRRYVPPEHFAIVYEGLGERDRALQWFEKAFAEHSMNHWLLPDPRLDSIRSEPRFKAIMRRMGLPQ
jgi:TolB-like protein/DNA-binding winged helix-turn-helix (wHTH) protein/Flp pilus assembly protein TadD